MIRVSVGIIFCYKEHRGSTKQCGDDDFDLVLEKVQNVTSDHEKKKVVSSIIYCKNCNLLSHLMDLEIAFARGCTK